ncbi:hypothetical protein [Herbaspirillum aquaticum]|uniref:Uncharacterized protein n=1 Tax=Herbaspirillum aquaticum TaxID=568783 RepID=A0A225STS5_9BURK|nr:hypothetical protein [Herbaspirillum aquaticum]OWY34643.1 hypothetical protein CEJ45_10100 [Herbaspirillum aquaticum]
MSKAKSIVPLAEQAQPTTTEEADTQSYWLLKASTAAKVGKFGKGAIAYAVTTDSDRLTLHIQITGNEGGGYFSREKVPFDAIEACLAGTETEQAFPSSTFKHAFSGRSSNNSGFMVAILRAEGLISVSATPGTKYEKSGDWQAWKASMLAEPGSLITEQNAQEQLPSNADSSSPSRGTLRLPKKKATAKDEAS